MNTKRKHSGIHEYLPFTVKIPFASQVNNYAEQLDQVKALSRKYHTKRGKKLTYRPRRNPRSACLNVIFKESSQPDVLRGGSYAKEVMPADSRHKVTRKTSSKQNTLQMTSHQFFFSIKSFPLPTRFARVKIRHETHKHRQQLNASGTINKQVLLTDLSGTAISFPVNENILKRITMSRCYNYTLADINHAFCQRCTLFLPALSRQIRGRSVERSCPLCKVDRTGLCSFQPRMEFMYLATDAHVYNYTHGHTSPNRLNSWKATGLVTGLVGSSSLLLSHSITNARSYTVPHYERTRRKAARFERAMGLVDGGGMWNSGRGPLPEWWQHCMQECRCTKYE